VRPDAEGFPVIPGRYGRIEWAGGEGEQLAVHCTRPKLFKKLRAIPGVRPHQTGDREMRATFPTEAFEQVAAVVKASRKSGFTSAKAKKVGAGTAFKGTSRPQDARDPVGLAQPLPDPERQLEEALK
jgi:hypothetical protein